jgi:N-acetylmuramoyl-L-alanine amidase
MIFQDTFRQTPNVSSNLITPTAIVLHHTAGNYAGSVAWCCNPKSKASYHRIVDLNGNSTTLAKDTQRAWHAGTSSFNGRSDCNSFTLGIAVSQDTNKRELSREEIVSVAQWCVEKMIKFKIPITNVTTHRAIAPNRKSDVDPRAEQAILNEIKSILNINC